MAFQISNFTSQHVPPVNTSIDGSGTITLAMTANGTYGSVLNFIKINSSGTTQLGMIRIFMRMSSGGSWSLIREIPVPPTTLNDPPYPVFARTIPMGLPLMNGVEIGIATDKNDSFMITCYGYDITGFI